MREIQPLEARLVAASNFVRLSLLYLPSISLLVQQPPLKLCHMLKYIDAFHFLHSHYRHCNTSDLTSRSSSALAQRATRSG